MGDPDRLRIRVGDFEEADLAAVVLARIGPVDDIERLIRDGFGGQATRPIVVTLTTAPDKERQPGVDLLIWYCI